MQDPVVPLERNLYAHPLAGLLWERQFEKILLKHGWEKIPNWECLFVHREKGLFLSVYLDDIKLAGKKQNLDPMWKLLNKEVDLGEPTSFLDHVYLDPPAGFLWERQFERILLELGLEKVPTWESLFVHRKQGLFLSVYFDDIKMVGKKQNMAPMWKKLMKNVDLDEPRSFLDHVYLECTRRECKPKEDIVEQYKEMFESRISADASEQLPGAVKPHAKTVVWSYDMEGHAQKCVERYCELANKKTEQLYKVFSSLCLDDHHVKKEELESVGELSEVCSQIVFTCLYLARIGRPDIVWSVNKRARSITKWTKACDK